MGTDITMYVEKRDKATGKWGSFDAWKPNPYRLKDDGSVYEDEPEFHVDYADRVYTGRNYDLFAILADVRNGSGFAGVRTGSGFNPISSARGLPDDLSPELAREAERDCGHDKSYLLLSEVVAADWDQTTVKEGVVDPWNFELWRRTGKPNSWSGGVSGQDVEHVSNRAMTHLIDSGDLQWDAPEPGPDDCSFHGRKYTTPLQRTMKGWNLRPGTVGATMADEGTKYYTIVEWAETYRSCTKHFHNEVMPKLLEIADPEDVRLVFWFGS